MKKRFTEEQIIGFPRNTDAGMPVKGLCRQHGFSEASYYLRRTSFLGRIESSLIPLTRAGGIDGAVLCRLDLHGQ